MANPFFDRSERRPRALWRLLFQYGLFLIIQTVLVVVAVPLSGGATIGGGGVAIPPGLFVIVGLASLAAAVLSVWLAGRFFDRRPLSDFGLRPSRATWWADFGFGLILGALLMVGLFVLELAFGWVSVTGFFRATEEGASFFPAILVPVVAFVCVGIYEELVSRGYQLRNLAEGLNVPGFLGPKGAVVAAWVISSVIFGLLHLANPNASAISTINITLAGIFLGAGYVLTGSLATPIGLHITWNFFQGNVFGLPVSGLAPVGATFVSVEQSGPDLVTGGVFGPEAGLLGIGAMVVGISLIWLWTHARSGEASLQASLAEPPSQDVSKRTLAEG